MARQSILDGPDRDTLKKEFFEGDAVVHVVVEDCGETYLRELHITSISTNWDGETWLIKGLFFCPDAKRVEIRYNTKSHKGWWYFASMAG